MKREHDKTVLPVEVNPVCEDPFLICPVEHPDAPAQCAKCGFWSNVVPCHRCHCHVCPLLMARHREELGLVPGRQLALPL